MRQDLEQLWKWKAVGSRLLLCVVRKIICKHRVMLILKYNYFHAWDPPSGAMHECHSKACIGYELCHLRGIDGQMSEAPTKHCSARALRFGCSVRHGRTSLPSSMRFTVTMVRSTCPLPCGCFGLLPELAELSCRRTDDRYQK